MANRNLILFFSGIGNAVLLIPMLRKLRKHEPAPIIEMVITQSVVKEILEPEGIVDSFIVFDNDRSRGILRYRLLQLRLMSTLRKNVYDRVFIVGNENINLFLFSVFVRAKLKIGYSKKKSPRNILTMFCNETVHFRRGVSECENRLDLLRVLGWDIPSIKPCLRLSEGEKAIAEKRVSAIANGKPVFGIHPGCSELLAFKRWPAEKFAQIVQYVHDNKGMQPVLFGGPGEEQIDDEIRSNINFDVPSFVGKLTIRESIAAIGRCSHFLSNDSGLMHIAAALNVPQVALFGDTDTAKNYPQSEHAIVLDGKTMQGDSHRAIENIRVNDVIDVLDKVI